MIEKARNAEDGSQNSFEIKLSSGGVTLRHKRHIRHDTAHMPPIVKKVKFDISNSKVTTDVDVSGPRTRSKAQRADVTTTEFQSPLQQESDIVIQNGKKSKQSKESE